MLHNKSFLPLSREKSNGTNERSIVQDRRNSLSDRISFPNYQLSSRNVFWTILTNENRPNHTGRSNLNVSSPQDSLDISSPDFQNQGLPPFNPRSSSRARATRRESRGKLSLSLSFSRLSGLHGDQSKILGTEEQVDNGTVSFYTTSGTDISKLDDESVAIALQKNARFEKTQQSRPNFHFSFSLKRKKHASPFFLLEQKKVSRRNNPPLPPQS